MINSMLHKKVQSKLINCSFISKKLIHIKGICVSPPPALAPPLNLHLSAPDLNLILPAQALNSVCLFFVLQLKFVIVTVSTYINSASTYMCLLFKYNQGNK